MHNVRLMKLLYMADRKCLEREARTITGDRIYAMRKGPVLSKIHNLIRGKDYQAQVWQCCIKKEGHDVYLAQDPGTGDLCRFEKQIIENVYRETECKNVIQISHTFPEWKKYEVLLNDPNMKNSYPITIEDILIGIGKPELMPIVEEMIAEMKSYKKLFAV